MVKRAPPHRIIDLTPYVCTYHVLWFAINQYENGPDYGRTVGTVCHNSRGNNIPRRPRKESYWPSVLSSSRDPAGICLVFYNISSTKPHLCSSFPLFHSSVPTTISIYVLTVNDNNFWVWCLLVSSCTEHLCVCGRGQGRDLTDTCCVL